MAHIKYNTNKHGVLVARVQVYGKNPATGKPKLYPKIFRNDDGLTEAKFKKKIQKLALELETKIANDYKDQMNFIHAGILTFNQLAQEWISTIKTHQSHNYYLRAISTCNLFNDYLKKVGLDKQPISEIRVRDIQLFLNSFEKGYVKGKPIAKLIKKLPKEVNFRELARENIIKRSVSYGMNNEEKNISLDTAKAICQKYKLNFDTYFKDVTTICKYSPETLKGHRRLLRTVFNEAVRYEWITKNPVCLTKIGANKGNDTLRPVEEKEVFSFKETQEFLKALNTVFEEFIHRVVPIKLMLLCGLRNGEVCGLRWTDIDFEQSTLSVNRSRLVS